MISVIIPFYNEEKNLPVLTGKLSEVLGKLKTDFEIIFIDDGSTDRSSSKLKSQISNLNLNTENFRIISHKKRKGKGKALLTGINNARGDIFVFIDADLQDDPSDLPKLLKKLNEGYDLVNGVRVDRQDSYLVKLYSSLAAKFLRIFLRSPYTDINCPFKVFRRSVLTDFSFYGNNFRFFPLTVFLNGYKVTEIPVKNHKRRYGQTKFGSGKLFLGIFDTITAYFLYKFSERPLHFFGLIGSVSFAIGSMILIYLGFERIFFGIMLYRRPILFLGILLVIVGIQVVMTGIIAELIVYLNKKSDKLKE